MTAENPLCKENLIPQTGLFSQDSLPLIDRKLTRIAETLDWKPEHHVSNEFPFAVSHAFYGRQVVGKEQILKRAERIMGRYGFRQEMVDIGDTTGFDRLYQLPTGLTEEQYLFFTTTYC